MRRCLDTNLLPDQVSTSPPIDIQGGQGTTRSSSNSPMNDDLSPFGRLVIIELSLFLHAIVFPSHRQSMSLCQGVWEGNSLYQA